MVEPDRARLEFGGEFGRGVWVGTQVVETLQLRNGGQQPLVISQMTLSGPQASSYALQVADGGALTLQSLQRAFVSVWFHPTDGGTYQASLTVTSNAASLTAPIQATAVLP